MKKDTAKAISLLFCILIHLLLICMESGLDIKSLFILLIPRYTLLSF